MLQEKGLILAFLAPQAIQQKYANNGNVVNRFCVMLLQVKGATCPLMSVHPTHARTALSAWITSVNLHAFVYLGGQAKHVMWTLMNATATLVKTKDNVLMN